MENMASDVMCGDFFDHIDDLLDFPNDDDRDFKAKAMAMGGMMPMETPRPPYIHSDCGGLLPPPPPPPPTFPSPPMDDAAFDQKGDQLFDDLDIADLEWVSSFMDDSASSFNLFFDFPAAAEHNKALEEESLFRTPSPVSVLQSNSLSGGGFASSTTTTTTSSSSSSSSSSSTSNFCYPAGNGRRSLPHFSSVVPARARSKRPRPAAARAHVTTPFLPTTTPPEPESFGEAVKKAKKKKNPLLLLLLPVSGEGEGEAGPQPQVRKCMHCEIQKTPQWRAGPMGPKTLCNACGVRYKSGRLFPEYRPAASPTFVPSLHSNSHKKVVEMRINATAPNSCDLLDYIRRRE